VRFREELQANRDSINLEGILRANKIGLILSSKKFESHKEDIDKMISKLLERVGCKNIEEYYEKLNKAKGDTKEVVKELNEVKRFYRDKDIELGSNREDLNKMYREVSKELNTLVENEETLLRYYQQINGIEMLKKCKFFDKEIYLPSFIDGRGRQYYYTLLSPTFYKIIRFCYNLSKKSDKIEGLEESPFY